jgi:2-polyprenyl-3-methyl-5-hydroxy-6-metoxy-1,4-benzoquinol methylase
LVSVIALVAGLPGAWEARVYLSLVFGIWGFALRHADPKPGERLLDVATGTGILAIPAAVAVGATGTVVGLDISPNMLTEVRGRGAWYTDTTRPPRLQCSA